MKVGSKPENPEKTPDDELQKMPHTKARKFKPQAILPSVYNSHFDECRATTLVSCPQCNE